MDWLSKFKYTKKGTEENKEIQEIIDKLPDNKACAREMLDSIDNDTSKIILDGGLKNSYYVYLNNTIYISNREKNKKAYSRICLVAHECVHSMQSKVLQEVNFILSNLELISFAILIILSILNKAMPIYDYIYYGIVIVSVIPRMILELDAVIKSVPLATKYLRTKLKDDEVRIVENVYSFQIKSLLPLFILGLLIGKIIRVIIVFFV